MLIVWTITLYMLTVFLYPPDLSEAEEHQGRFERNRAGYYSTFIAMCLLDVTQTATHGDIFFIRSGALPFVGQYAVLAGAGLIAHRRGYDRFFACAPTDHAAGLGACGETTSRGRRDDS